MFGHKCNFIGSGLSREVVNEVTYVGFNPSIVFAVKSIRVHEECGDRSDWYGRDVLLCGGGIMIGFTVEGGWQGDISGVCFGVGNGGQLSRDQIKDPAVI